MSHPARAPRGTRGIAGKANAGGADQRTREALINISEAPK